MCIRDSVHPIHGEHGEADKRQLDIKIRVGEGLGGVGSQKEQACCDIDSEARPHDGEEPLQRLEWDIGSNPKNTQVTTAFAPTTKDMPIV